MADSLPVCATPVSTSDQIGQRKAFADFASRLTWSTGSFEVIPLCRRRAAGNAQGTRPIRPGFLIHSLLGLGLRRVACRKEPHCAGACASPSECAYGLLLEPRPGVSEHPLSGVARVPVPVAIDAPWSLWEWSTPLRFRIQLLGRATDHRSVIEDALIEGFVEGTAGACPVSLAVRGWSEGRIADVVSNVDARTSIERLRMTMLSPVRLLRQKKALDTFDMASVARDLMFRISVWGHYHEDLEWPRAWRFLQDDAAAVRIKDTDVRLVSFYRYSGRQDHVIPMKGLLGTVEIERVSPELALLLRLGEICSIGKGASIGLGRALLKALDIN